MPQPLSWIKEVFKKVQNLSNLPAQIRASVKEEIKGEALTAAQTAAKAMSGAAAIGALAGAVMSPKGEAGEGAARGAIGGVIGGVGGFGWGKHVLPAVGGAIVGGALAGKTVSKKERPMLPKMEDGFKFAGVILDYYDDHGETLKQKFSTPDDLPGVIKTASIQPKEKLPNEAFALIMVDQGHAFRKYACADPGTTAMSVIYFMEHGDKLPEDAQKTAATNLVEACLEHKLMPPVALIKTSTPRHVRVTSVFGEKLDPPATVQAKTASTVDVTGQQPKPIFKSAGVPQSDDDYAVVMPDGNRHYPIHNWNMVKQAESYFTENRIRMEPEVRREFAVKLARKSFVLGYPLRPEIIELGALGYHNSGHIKVAMEMRKPALDPESGAREFLDGLFEKRAEIHPEVFAECVRRVDVEHGLDKGWDHVVLDPWATTFGVKTAEVVWEHGADRVTDDALRNLAENHLDLVQMEFTDHMAEGFKMDPVAIFKSMPDPNKKLLARMAMDSESYGGSEAGTTPGL